jgi:release factor glutamine methyltransferase
MKSFEDFIHSYEAFKRSEVEDPLIETLRLFDLLSSGKTREVLSVSGADIPDITDIARQRRNGLPLEYILGRATFMGRSFLCTADTLIPTEETSLLVRTACEFIDKRLRAGLGTQTVIEIGTGCGNIAVSLAKLCDENVRILASDVSFPAVEIARQNVNRFNSQEKVKLFSGDLFEPFGEHAGKADMVICNPPYIPTTSLRKLSSEITDYEPILALDGGAYGISFFRRLINGSLEVLRPDGVLVFEIGEGQEKLIGRLFDKNSSYREIEYFMYGESVRVVSALRK